MEQETELVRSGGRSDERAEGKKTDYTKRKEEPQHNRTPITAEDSNATNESARNANPRVLLTRRSPTVPRKPEYQHFLLRGKLVLTMEVNSFRAQLPWGMGTNDRKEASNDEHELANHGPGELRLGKLAKHLINRHVRKQDNAAVASEISVVD